MRFIIRQSRLRLVSSSAIQIVAAIAIFLYAGGARSDTPNLPEVVVSGEQPGPGLWKVTKGDHVLWVLGTVPVLPKHMKWEMDEVKKALASSQAILSPPDARADLKMGFFSQVMLLPSMYGVQRLPDGATLQQVLPPPLYERWTALREKYVGGSRGLERLRPFIAAVKLADKAYDQAGLTDDAAVTSAVHKLAQHYRLEQVDARFHFVIQDPKSVIRDFKQISPDESACFSDELDHLEHALATAVLRANAWATGDVMTLKSSLEQQTRQPCLEMFSGTAFSRQLGIDDLRANTQRAWLSAAENALAKNQQTFAMLGMSDVLLSNGLLSMLQARGYEVQAAQE